MWGCKTGFHLLASSLAWTVSLSCVPAEPGPPLSIEPAVLPNAVEGTGYSETLTADGREPMTWTVSAGNLPPGLALGARSGQLAGTPTEAGTFTFTVDVADRSSPERTGSRQYVLTVLEALTVDMALPSAREEESYRHVFATTGGVPPYNFELIGLPAGLTFDAATGTVTGTPPQGSARANIPLQVTVRDSGNPQQQVSELLSLLVKPLAVRIVTTDLPPARVNVPYTADVEASDGQPPYRWTVISGILPSGGVNRPRLNETTGRIAGTPTAVGTFVFTVRVVDSDAPATEATQELSIEVGQ